MDNIGTMFSDIWGELLLSAKAVQGISFPVHDSATCMPENAIH